MSSGRRLAGAVTVLAIALSSCGSSHHGTSGSAESDTNPTGMTSSTPTGLAIPAKVTPIHAVFTRRLTHYTIKPLDRTTRVTYSWTLSPPPRHPSCNRIIVETGPGNEVSWRHASCRLGSEDGGTIHVVVRSATWQCTADYFGIATGTGKQPVCLKV